MDSSENKGLLATFLLLVSLFLFGYYGKDHQSDSSSKLLQIENSQLLINKDLEDY